MRSLPKVRGIELRNLLVRYMAAKTALRQAMPGVSDAVLDRLAECLGEEIMVPLVRTIPASIVARQVKGRKKIAAGLQPALKKAIVEVMGPKTMGSAQIFEALNVRGWLPTSRNPAKYVGEALSRNPETFERVLKGRVGAYRVPPHIPGG